MSEYTKNDIKALLSTEVSEGSSVSRFGAFYDNLMDNGKHFYRAAPWKIVPGPWAMRVAFSHGGEIVERFVVITGATNKAHKGLIGYRTLDDYSAQRLNFVVTCEHSPPTFMKLPVHMALPMTAKDFIFLEVALRAVADFLTEAARMGGGGLGHAMHNTGAGAHETQETQALSATDVLSALGSHVQRGGSETFPCKQSVSAYSAWNSGNSKDQVSVSVHVVLTQSALAQAQKDVSRPVASRVPLPLSAESSQCMVCLATESDVRSRKLCRMKLCECKSLTEKYCSRECQVRDWPRHKRSCKHHLAKLAKRSQAEAEAEAGATG
jgi:hypothetical protein